MVRGCMAKALVINGTGAWLLHVFILLATFWARARWPWLLFILLYDCVCLSAYRQRRHSSTYQVYEAAVITNLFMPEQSRQHGQGMIRECLVDEWLLAFKGLDRAARGERVILIELRSNDFRKQFRHCWQPVRSPPVPAVFWLAHNKLAAVSRVSNVEPVGTLLE